MKFCFCLVPVLLVFGCARFHTTQTDYSYDGTNGVPTRKIVTRISVTTLLEANSEVSKINATQTDKSQGAKVGSISQTANSTNLPAIFGAMSEGIVKGMK
jgi:hypothetical protein